MCDNSIINLAYCTDSNYLEYVATSLVSVLTNNRKNKLQFYVFVYDINDSEIEKLISISDNIKVIKIKKSDIEKYSDNFQIKHLNRSTYIRLAVPRLLNKKVDKFIYLDADTLCFDDISSINAIDINNFICAASYDSLKPEDSSKHVLRLGLASGNYFNAGFLYINVSNWIKNDTENKANKILSEYGNKLTYFDQDALNIAMDGHVKFIDNKWNYLFNWFTEEQKETFFYQKNIPMIVHFTGPRKPWYKEHTGLSQMLYIFYHHFTPWRNIPLNSYVPRMRPTDYRVYSRQNAKKGKYFAAIKWYVKYLKSKL
ncbi:glycosyltransferase family 8 protein [Salmonella enterica subsp. enterica serovar Enteritidis]|nr:glycosyltransferase family 8 protein [Salmonella enterica subsp. enterica serovar Enteritidis]EGW9206054.1 glycosyltransferase family 8 protein [Salmonella enterica subsp. enterica serovar Enteritidis]